MGISKARFTRHVLEQQSAFQNYRKSWPLFLYRHEPIESAIKILKTGELRSRLHAAGCIVKDIAPDQIISNRDVAHDRVRLYFRPRNPTQYHVEGIRKPADYYNGKHAGFLVMFLFDSEKILIDPETSFSCGNMQSHASNVLSGDEAFDTLDFERIYHDSAQRDAEITRMRCAEVLVQNPLNLVGPLKYIVVRTDADQQTLKFLFDESGLNHFSSLVRKTQGPGLFFEDYTAVDYVDVAPGMIKFRLKQTRSAGDIKTYMRLVDMKTGNVVAYFRSNLAMLKIYQWEPKVMPGTYQLQCELEDCFAHNSIVNLP